MIAAWTRSKSLFSSRNIRSRAPFSLFSSAPFCAFKPFSSSSSSASLLPEALLEAILTTKRHGSMADKRNTETPSRISYLRAAQPERSTKIYQVETVTSGQSGAAGVSWTEHCESTVLYVQEYCTCKSATIVQPAMRDDLGNLLSR